MVGQQSKGSFGQLMGVIRCFPNSFHILPCQSVRKNLKPLRLLSLGGPLVNSFELSSHELCLKMREDFSDSGFPVSLRPPQLIPPSGTELQFPESQKLEQVKSKCQGASAPSSFSCHPKEGIWVFHHSVNWDLQSRLYGTIKDGFSLKEPAKKHIGSENSAQTKDKCVCNKVQMAGLISFMFSTELPYIKVPRVSRFYKTQRATVLPSVR